MKLDLEFQNDVPDGWMPLEATVIYKALDDQGVIHLGQSSTTSVTSWEVAGMLVWALDGVRADLREGTDDG
jgi:hypothetical protein